MVYCVLLEQQKKYPKYLERIFTKEEAAQMHLTGDFDFVIEAATGCALEGPGWGAAYHQCQRHKGIQAIGLHPRPPALARGTSPLHRCRAQCCIRRIIHGGRLIDHAPTILRLLGLEPIGMDGHPVDALVRP